MSKELNLTAKEAAVRLRLSPRTLKAWRVNGVGPRYMRFGSRILYPESELEAFEHANLVETDLAAAVTPPEQP